MKHCVRVWLNKVSQFWFIFFYFVTLSGWSAFYEKDSSRCGSFKHLSGRTGVLGQDCSCVCQVVSSCFASRTGWSPNPNEVQSIRVSLAFFLNHCFCWWEQKGSKYDFLWEFFFLDTNAYCTELFFLLFVKEG